VKLLFDANLAHKLIERLADVFPGSTHVSRVGLVRASDRELWAYALEHGFMLVSKDRTYINWPSSRGLRQR